MLRSLLFTVKDAARLYCVGWFDVLRIAVIVVVWFLYRKQSDGNTENRPRNRNKLFGIKDIYKLDNWNVRAINTKEQELEEELNRKQINTRKHGSANKQHI